MDYFFNIYNIIAEIILRNKIFKITADVNKNVWGQNILHIFIKRPNRISDSRKKKRGFSIQTGRDMWRLQCLCNNVYSMASPGFCEFVHKKDGCQHRLNIPRRTLGYCFAYWTDQGSGEWLKRRWVHKRATDISYLHFTRCRIFYNSEVVKSVFLISCYINGKLY